MIHRQYQTVAQTPDQLSVRGDYLEVRIGRIILDALVRPRCYDEEVRRLTLIELIYSNLWAHRIPLYQNLLMIDSAGFQHSPYRDIFFEARVEKSKFLKKGTELPTIAEILEGNARTHGWFAFPKSSGSTVPHRFIFKHHVFAPGYTCGTVQQAQTLEIALDLSVFQRLLGDGE